MSQVVGDGEVVVFVSKDGDIEVGTEADLREDARAQVAAGRKPGHVPVFFHADGMFVLEWVTAESLGLERPC